MRRVVDVVKASRRTAASRECTFHAFSSSPSSSCFSGEVHAVLGIETSCDDTGVAIVNSHGKILAQTIVKQTELHRALGGIKPDVAARAHQDALASAVKKVLQEAEDSLPEKGLSAVAVTAGPGLAPCLKVGVSCARNLSIVGGS